MAKRTTPQLPLFERMIQAVSPAWALARHKDRVAIAATGGYVGASYRESLAYFQPGTGDADSDSITDLPELRGRSRDLVRNSPVAAGAIETDVSHVVGTGLTLQCRIDAEALGITTEQARKWQKDTERLFCMWAESEMADAFAELNFYELQELAYRTSQESGDGFTILAQKSRASWPFRLALQLIEADRVSNPDFKPDTATLVAGKERANDGELAAFHFCDRHHGASTFGKAPTWQRVEVRGAKSGRRNVLHLMRKKRPGQSRGTPALAPIIETVKQLTRYSSAEVDAAVNSAVNAVFTQMDHEAFSDTFDGDAQKEIVNRALGWDGDVAGAKGRVINLLPGETVASPTPGRPNPNFDPFFNSVLQQIGMALDIPHEVLTKRFQSSYSAARAALLAFWRTVKIRRTWFAAKFCQPVYEEWLADAVADGLIAAPGFFADPLVRHAWSRTSWAGDGPGALNPLDEANAAEKRLKLGVTTLDEEIVAYDGGDWEAKHAAAVRIRDARLADGLDQAPPDPNAMRGVRPGAPGQPPAPQPGKQPQPPQPGATLDGKSHALGKCDSDAA